MNSSGKISYFFRKYTLIRLACLLFIIAAGLGIFFLIQSRNKPAPVIESIVPPVGSPGDVVVINGKNFGDIRDMSYVEFSGVKLTASSYLSWSDTKIKIILPANIQDGLVIVGAKGLTSKPSLFANDEDIPVLVPATQLTNKPVISELSSPGLYVGDLLTIEGNNFGEMRNQSKVLFTTDYNNKIKNSSFITKNLITENLVEVCDAELGYEYWSNTEIRVRIPDGAVTGVVIVETGKDRSDPMEFNILTGAGTKEYVNKKQYLIQYEVGVKDVISTDNGTFTVRCPIPEKFGAQPNVLLTEISPSPSLKNYHKCNIQQLSTNRNNVMKETYTQTFIIDVFETNTFVKPEKVVYLKEQNPELYKLLAYADELVPADDPRLVELYKKIVGTEKNQYRRAKMVYDFMCDNYEILSKTRKDDADPFDLLTKKKGDAFDYAVIYAALLRTAGVPAIVDGGVLVNQNLKTQAHWWCEVYLQNFGWMPVDVALGDGMEYKKMGNKNNDRDYYFGNLDSSHITFSRGMNPLKPFAQENTVVKYNKSFALQSVWEEVSANISKYSTYWNLPVIKGVY